MVSPSLHYRVLTFGFQCFDALSTLEIGSIHLVTLRNVGFID
jgi:hypothetical protein